MVRNRQSEKGAKEETEGRFRPFLPSIAGPLIVALILAGLGGLVSGWRNDLLFAERLGVIDGRVIELEAEAKKGGRFTVEDATELRRKYDALQAGLTDLRVLIAGMKVGQNGR